MSPENPRGGHLAPPRDALGRFLSNPTLPHCRNVHALPRYEQLWLLGRAGEFDLVDGVEVPTYSYARIAANFIWRRKIRISRFAVRRFILRQDPELARRRGYPWRLARLTRREVGGKAETRDGEGAPPES